MSSSGSRRGARAVAVAAMLTLAGITGIVGFMLRPAVEQPAGGGATLSSVEVGFLQDMSSHHQQAISMSQMVDRPDVDDRVRSLARQIQMSQQNEIGTIVGWLQLTDSPLSDSSPMQWMTRYAEVGGGHSHDAAGHAMPGMATPDEVASLGSLPPDQAAARFLQYMQRHHYGGIAMAQDLVAQVPNGLVAQLAQSMISEQSKETGLMGTMLAERGAASAPAAS